MNNTKSTKRALLLSIMAMLLCVVLLVGTTFAWFTDSATSTGNKIQAGTLNIDLLVKDGENYKSVKESEEAIFNYDKWEPGYTEVKNVMVSTTGNLALKYMLKIVPQTATEEAFKLAEVIDVYYANSEVTVADRNDLSALTRIGTLKDIFTAGTVINDTLIPDQQNTKDFATIALKMQESAGNDYQGLSVGNGFDLNLVATQYTYEEDSFGNDYDAGADVELATSTTINGQSYASVKEAYEAVQPQVSTVFGLGQEAFSASDADKCAKFDELFPDGKITWTIYGEQKLTDAYMLSFGRKASYFGARTLKEIEVVGGNSQATLDLTGTDGTFALPYNWWGSTVDNIKVTFKGITFKGIKSIPGTWATPEQETPYTFENCTFNGNVYGYHDYNINLTIKNCTFNAPANTKYALMLQSTTGITGKVTVDGCNFNGYTRGVNFQRPNTEFVFTNNTIRSTVSEPDRGAIQLTDGKSFMVTGNTVDVNAGNAFWFHEAATNGNVTYTISNNDVKAPYIGYSGVTTFDVNTKITSSGNKFNSTDTTKCMKKGATVAEATNLTAIH